MKNNETIQSILARRSYKAFRADPISDEDLETILEAGKYAPTGMNRQAWHFTVVKSPDGKAMFKAAAAEALKRRGPFRPGPGMPPPPPPAPGIIMLPEDEFRGAPVLIVVSGDAALETASIDCVCAMENMFIAAASLGIMSGWTHMVVKDLLSDAETKKQFRIPPGYEVYAAAFFGYPLGRTKDRGLRKEGTVTYL
ncbi:MAG TPA: nitroreductase family protein [Dehalococcoidales bacterium]|nr:nitroreductase family protein [Dehalococcoidales bacterium]